MRARSPNIEVVKHHWKQFQYYVSVFSITPLMWISIMHNLPASKLQHPHAVNPTHFPSSFAAILTVIHVHLTSSGHIFMKNCNPRQNAKSLTPLRTSICMITGLSWVCMRFHKSIVHLHLLITQRSNTLMQKHWATINKGEKYTVSTE